MVEQNETLEIFKIIVTGAFSSGKSKFCESISNNDWRKITEQNYQFVRGYWHFELDDKRIVRLFIAEGSFRFSFISEVFSEVEGDFFGSIIMLDSSSTETFREARSIIETLHYYSLAPFVIAANKQDREGAWDAESLRIVLRIRPEIPIIPCVASDKKSVANVLIALCEEALRDLENEEEAET